MITAHPGCLCLTVSRDQGGNERLELIRLQGHHNCRQGKDVDIPDAAALVKHMVDREGRPLSFDYIRSLNYNGFDVEAHG